MVNMKQSLAYLPFFLTTVISAALPLPGRVSYDGYKVFRIKTGQQFSVVNHQIASLGLEPWNEDIIRHVDVAVPPEKLTAFNMLNLDHSVMIRDLGHAISREVAPEISAKRQQSDWYDPNF